MPIRIYLDSQDYAKLYKSRIPELEKVYQFLKEKIDLGEIEIGFSFPVIAELLQNYTPEFKEDRVARAKFIKELCGKKCFTFYGGINSSNSFSYDGIWTPPVDEILSLKKMQASITETIEDNISIYSRKQRRLLKKQKFVKDLKNPNNFKTDKMDYRELDFPISERFLKENILSEFMAGRISQKEADLALYEVISDPELFLKSWFEFSNKQDYLKELIFKSFEKLKDMVIKAREYIALVKENKKAIKDFQNKVYESPVPNMFKAQLKQLKKTINEAPQISYEWVRGLFNEINKDGELPESFFDAMYAYLMELHLDNRVIKDSDFGDILHAIYLPYCDLWRGDKAFSNILIRQNILHADKIVTSLPELPKRISYLLEIKEGFAHA